MRLQYFPQEPRWKSDLIPLWEFGCCCVLTLVLGLASWGLR